MEAESMEARPILDRNLDGETFKSFYYLKEELVDFCRQNNLPTSGGKLEITERIATFLDTGKVVKPVKVVKAVKPGEVLRPYKVLNGNDPNVGELTENSLIEENFACTEKHRAFFKEKIGKSFSFNVLFQKWLKSNAGKTYGDAIEAYYQILEEKKQGKTVIDKQFEYNTYIRDFFEDNKGKSLEEAIICWKYKKSIQGHNRYEKSDLVALE